MIDAGNNRCTAGLSKALYDTLAADTNAGFSFPLAAAQVTILKALCWGLAQGIAAKVNAGGMTVTDGATTYDLGTLELTGSGVSLSYDAGTNKLTATISGGGGGAVSSVFGRTGVVVAANGDYTPSQVGADAAGTAAGLVSSEASTRAAADTTLAGAITSEATARVAGDAATLSSAQTYAAAQVAAIPADGSAATPSLRTLGTSGVQACAGNDSRLANSRAPTAHASTHASGGSDPVSPASIGALATSALSSATPAALGTAAAGTSASVSRADHVHQLPTAADVGADASGAAAAVLASSAQRASNLSDLSSVSAARTNLGLGTAATHAVTDFDASGAAAAALTAAESYADGIVATEAGIRASAVSSEAAARVSGDSTNAAAAAAAQATANAALPTAGGTMSGDIAMGTHRVTGLSDPASAQDADTKAARDTAIAAVTTTTLGAVPTGRTLTATAPLRIDSGASADLSANRTLSVANASTSATGVIQIDSANPQPLGTAAPGSTGKAADSGHVHALPTLAALGAGLQRAVLPVASPMASPTGATSVQGFVYLDPAAWAIAGKTLVATLEVMGNTSAAACTATAALYTSSTGIITNATTTITAQTPTRYTHTLTVPGGATLYELRVTPSGGTGGVDYAVCGANLILTWS